jgi:hypothetical protein
MPWRTGRALRPASERTNMLQKLAAGSPMPSFLNENQGLTTAAARHVTSYCFSNSLRRLHSSSLKTLRPSRQ